MKIGIFGSGNVGKAIGGKLASLGHDVILTTRHPDKLKDWLLKTGGDIRVGSIPEAAAHGEILFNATSGKSSMDVLAAAGPANLKGKILIDISNPLVFSAGGPPTFFVANTDSLGEQIQRTFPEVRVVKTLNTVTAVLMVDPRQVADGDHAVFVSGNDTQAKAMVVEILKDWFGWKQVIDLGDITSARAAEMYMAIWLRLRASFATSMINVKIVR
jgi:8-hydroxy-5-deazaflavin:NADPH oxidoreductase